MMLRPPPPGLALLRRRVMLQLLPKLLYQVVYQLLLLLLLHGHLFPEPQVRQLLPLHGQLLIEGQLPLQLLQVALLLHHAFSQLVRVQQLDDGEAGGGPAPGPGLPQICFSPGVKEQPVWI